MRHQALAQAKVRLENGQVPVVDPDKSGSVSRGPLDLRFGMNLEKRVKPCGLGGIVEQADLGIVQGTDDDQDGACAGLPGFEHLERMDHEVLAQAGEMGGGRPQVGAHVLKILERSPKKLCIGQDGKGVGARLLVGPRLVDRRGIQGNITCRGGSPLDLGDHGKPSVGSAKRSGKGRGLSQGCVQPRKFPFGNPPKPGGYLPALPFHDLGQLVVHAHNETTPAALKPDQNPCVGRPKGPILRAMSAIEELRHTIARLRGPGGCPWDQEQTHQSLTRCLIDECAELLDTIDRSDMPHMREELGDVLIQVIFHAQLAEESGHFNLEDVAREVNEKLVRRHPHVFGSGKLETSAQVLTQWEQIKAVEKKEKGKDRPTLFKEMPPRLPSIMYAEALWKQLGKKGLVAESGVDAARVASLGSGLDDAALGRMLFEVVAAAQSRDLDPEGALRRHTDGIMRHVEGSAQKPRASA